MRFSTGFLVRHPRIQYPAFWSLCALEGLRALAGGGRSSHIASSEPMLLILGAGRSGNTLLRKLLMERGRIYIPPESYVWCAQVLATMRSRALPWEDRVALVLGRLEYHPEFTTFDVSSLRLFAGQAVKWPEGMRSTGNLLHGLYAWLAALKSVDAEWLGDKTPLNLMGVGLVSKLFPKARYVYIERDGVDVAHSYRQAGIFPSLEDGAARWRDSRIAWRRFRGSVPSDRRMEIKFEELLCDHAGLVDEVLRKFGIPKRDTPLEVVGLMGDVTARDHHRDVRGEVRARSRGDLREILQEPEKIRLRKAFGRSLIEAGYKAI